MGRMIGKIPALGRVQWQTFCGALFQLPITPSLHATMAWITVFHFQRRPTRGKTDLHSEVQSPQRNLDVIQRL